MATTDHEKDPKPINSLATADATNISEPAVFEPLQYVESESDLSVSDPEKEGLPKATRTVTQTTTTSSLTAESERSRSMSRKPWHERLNPFKSRRLPRVPKERTVSKEYGASFLSMLTFQWMSPVMKVKGS